MTQRRPRFTLRPPIFRSLAYSSSLALHRRRRPQSSSPRLARPASPPPPPFLLGSVSLRRRRRHRRHSSVALRRRRRPPSSSSPRSTVAAEAVVAREGGDNGEKLLLRRWSLLRRRQPEGGATHPCPDGLGERADGWAAPTPEAVQAPPAPNPRPGWGTWKRGCGPRYSLIHGLPVAALKKGGGAAGGGAAAGARLRAAPGARPRVLRGQRRGGCRRPRAPDRRRGGRRRGCCVLRAQYTIVPTSLQLITMGTQMVTIDPMLSLLAATVIPCMCVVIASLGKRLRQMSKEAHLSLAMLTAYLNDVVPSMLTVKANNGELKEILRFQKLARDNLKNNLDKKKMKTLIPQAVRATCIGGLLVLCAGSMVVSGTSFDAEGFLSFLTALALVVEPIQDLGKAYNEYKQGEPALERIFDLMRFNPEVTDKPSATHLQHVNGDIKFHDVTFRYVDSMPPVVDGVNLHIRPGESIAFVGPSGGGKSTLAKLLLRLYHPQSGYMLLDNHDVQDIQLQCLRTHIAFVSQDAMLFSGTIAENIAYRDPLGDINMARVEYAAKIAHAEEFIKMLPEGYDSNVGQRGSSLSGGQKQRLAIARAVYQNSSILIMDEATSALDIRSELLLKEALRNLMTNHTVTVLIIAHQQEMVLMADRIVSLEGGKLQEITKLDFLSQNGHLQKITSPN